MSETRPPTPEKLYIGPFQGSDRPDKIASFPDNSSQIIWKKPGSTVHFSEDEVQRSPMLSDLHRSVGYRLLQQDGSVVGIVFTEDVVVARDYSYNNEVVSEKAYTRKGIDRNYDTPGHAVIGEPISLLSGTYVGQLVAVNEATRPPYHGGYASSGRNMAEYLLHGDHGMYGGEYDDIPGVDLRSPNKLLASLDVAEHRVQTAIDNVGIIAVQNLGVVTR